MGCPGHLRAIFHHKWDVSASGPEEIPDERKEFFRSSINLTMPSVEMRTWSASWLTCMRLGGTPEPPVPFREGEYTVGDRFSTTADAFNYGAVAASRCLNAVQVEVTGDSIVHEHCLSPCVTVAWNAGINRNQRHATTGNHGDEAGGEMAMPPRCPVCQAPLPFEHWRFALAARYHSADS